MRSILRRPSDPEIIHEERNEDSLPPSPFDSNESFSESGEAEHAYEIEEDEEEDEIED